MRPAGNALCVVSACRCAETPAGGKKADSSAKGDKAASKDVAKQWADLVARREKLMESLEDLEARFQKSDNEGRKRFSRNTPGCARNSRGKFNREWPRSHGHFEKDPTDSVAAQFVIGKAIEAQKYADVLAILKKLIKSAPPGPI